MKRTFTALAAATGLAVAGLAVAAMTAHAAPVPGHHAAAATAAVYDCQNKPVVRPSEFDIFCDGSRSLTKLSWASWNATEATGTGVDWIDDCVPNCAQGHWSHQNAVIVLWRPTPVAHHAGQYGFSKMTLLYPSTGKTETITPPGAY